MIRKVIKDVWRNHPIRMKTWASVEGRAVTQILTRYSARLLHFFIHHEKEFQLQRVGWRGHAIVRPATKSLVLQELYLMERATYIWDANGKEVLDNGLEMQPLIPVHHIFKDASTFGMGAWHLQTNQRVNMEFYQGLATRSSNFREAVADVECTKAIVYHNRIKDCTVALFTDNMTGRSYLRKHGGKVIELGEVFVPFIRWLYYERNIRHIAEHIPGMLNDQADDGSRLLDNINEYCLSTPCQTRLFESVGYPDLDCMASTINVLRHHPPFVSFQPDPNSVAFDVFSCQTSMDGLITAATLPYFFPPEQDLIIWKVLRLIERLRLRQVLLVTPLWTGHSWWPTLMSMTCELPTILPRNAVQPPTLQVRHRAKTPRLWRQVCWTISAVGPKCSSFRDRLSKALCPATQMEDMATTTSVNSWLGAGSLSNTKCAQRILVSLMS